MCILYVDGLLVSMLVRKLSMNSPSRGPTIKHELKVCENLFCYNRFQDFFISEHAQLSSGPW